MTGVMAEWVQLCRGLEYTSGVANFPSKCDIHQVSKTITNTMPPLEPHISSKLHLRLDPQSASAMRLF